MALRLQLARPMAKRTAAKTYDQSASAYAESEMCVATRRNQRVRTTFVFHADRAGTPSGSWSLTTTIDVPDGGAEGPIAVIGGATAGWSLSLDHGIPTFWHGHAGGEPTCVRGSRPLDKGLHAIRLEIAGSTARLFVDDRQVAHADIPQPLAFIYSADQTFDLPLAKFSGTLVEVAVDLNRAA